MSPYFILLIVCFCFIGSFLEISTRKSLFVAAVAIVCFSTWLVATRNPQVVPDTDAYIYVYNRMSTASFNSWELYNFYGFEPGYIFLNILFNEIGMNYEGFFAAVYLIQVFFYVKGMKILDDIHQANAKLRHTLMVSTFISIYLGYFGLFYGAIVLRTGIALSMIFLAYAYYQSNKKVKAIIFAAGAVLFHTSAIILLIAILGSLFIKNKPYNFYKKWISVIVLLWLSRVSLLFNKMLVVIMGFVSHIVPVLNRYMTNKYIGKLMGNGFASKKNLLYLALGLLFVSYLKKKCDTTYCRCLNIYLIGLTVTCFFNEYSNGYRVYDLMIVFAIPLLLWIITDNNGIKLLNRLGIAEVVILLQFLMTYRILVG